MNYKLKLLLLRAAPRFLRRYVMTKRYDREVAERGEAELLELRKFVRPGSVAIDIGCNLGSYTYEMSRLGARVYAFEPNPALANFVASLALPNVEVRQAAAAAENGIAELNIPLEHAGSHGRASLKHGSSLGKMEKVSVPTCRIDDLPLGKIGFIKIDVEGFEEEVLRGSTETISRDRPVLLIEIEERHNAGAVTRIADLLRKFQYEGWYVRQGDWHRLDPESISSLQNLERIATDEEHVQSRREMDYINNFFFLPPGISMTSSSNGLA